jgi:phosphate uptake regulator
MKRKVNRVGKNTLTVSLPSVWVKNLEIKQGDDLYVTEESRKLILSQDNLGRRKKVANISLEDINKHMLSRHLHEFYRQGIEEISIRFSRDKIKDYKNNKDVDVLKCVKGLVDRFIGMEIVSHTKDKIVLQSLMSAEEFQKLPVVQKRIYFLIKEFFQEFVSSMGLNFKEFHSKSYDYHDNIAKFTYYYMRLLHFSDMKEGTKTRLFSLFMIIDKIIDKVRHTSERVNEMKKITPKIKNYVEEVFNLFLEQFDFINKPKFFLNEVEPFVMKRYALVERINKEKFSEEELKVISECKVMLDTVNDFSETHVALHIEKHVR